MGLLLMIYCVIFSFVGISYGTWVSQTIPPGRRIGFLEFLGECLVSEFVPLVFVVSSRDNVFSFVTSHISTLTSCVVWSVALPSVRRGCTRYYSRPSWASYINRSRVSVDVEETVLEVGRGSDGAIHLLVHAFI